LNIGICQAQGDIVVRVDGHCEIAPDYVSQCVRHLLYDGVDAVGGPIETIGETNEAQSIALAMSSWFGVGGSAFRTVKDRPLLVETVAFPAYTRRTLQRLGPFDEELVRNQDDEYNYRLLAQGGKILLSPDISSRYYSRSSLRSCGGNITSTVTGRYGSCRSTRDKCGCASSFRRRSPVCSWEHLYQVSFSGRFGGCWPPSSFYT
jgi:succinoglycan biosynthesis protein ExoA